VKDVEAELLLEAGRNGGDWRHAVGLLGLRFRNPV
jgi:hypothetical protein